MMQDINITKRSNDNIVPLPPRKRIEKLVVTTILFIFVPLFFLLLVVIASLNDARKPAIYLYPTEDMQVQVEVDVRGFMHNDIPKYRGGWDVFATADGIIEGQYDYLFYEALLFSVDLPDEGWVVPYGELKTWFATMLPALGLNEKESRQFMEYWLAELPVAEYYEVKLFDEEFLNKHLKLTINPTPETVIRLLFHFTPLSEDKNIPEPTIVSPERNGFTVVEWGGILTD